ncbi:uncharacterized protein LOC111616454 [Centruroides sculpturatus]|uniref:uncharacterized protein LOC111616454 n=1 Tax=Centruroides sculpturatus TaxID=218467 RepID=UPI000C6E9430|nr:uncharacterized protein LOC111616454 [Centruroides sculpturatus]
MAKIELELFTDLDKYLFFESSIRGGLSLLANRYSHANNPYISQTYDNSKPHSYIITIDSNNLYGLSMVQYLPYSEFRWLRQSEIDEFNIKNVSSKSEIGYILEVDLEYPVSLHDRHNDLPLAVSHETIEYDDLSEYQKSLLSSLNLKFNNNVKKLVPTLKDKLRYIVHYRNLKYYLKEGLILKKIHRILSFKQAPYLQPYIFFNNEKRKLSNSQFDKNFFKLMNNSFYGKCMQNVRKKINLKAGLNKDQCKKYLNDPALESFQIINEDCSVFRLKRTNLLLDKPLYIGFCVLELSKLHMYQIYYEVFKNYYNDRVKLLYTDTDSLILEIYTDDIYDDFKNNLPNIFDFSNYPLDHPLYSEENKNELGFFKDEAKSFAISEFVGLKAKMYSISGERYEKKTAKGINKSVVKSTFHHELYKTTLFKKQQLRHNQTQIVSKNHVLTTQFQNKISLSAFYDKKYILSNGIDTLSYGHYSISS